jgi:hypothetical protein
LDLSGLVENSFLAIENNISIRSIAISIIHLGFLPLLNIKPHKIGKQTIKENITECNIIQIIIIRLKYFKTIS